MSSLNGTFVGPRGPARARVMIVGERPGEEEARTGRPFVGRSGQEQEAYLKQHGLSSYQCYVTNLVKTYDGGKNPDQSDVDEWAPVMEEEIASVRPRVILAVGRWSARWFLGDVDMEMVHGIPCTSERAPGAIVVPCYHPANAFYDDTGQVRALIAYDYAQAAQVIEGKLKAEPRTDKYEGIEIYRDVSGTELALELSFIDKTDIVVVIGLDTEGTPDNPWSVQISLNPGTGLVLRKSRPDFEIGIRAIGKAARSGKCIIAIHNGMYDLEMCRVMGLDLSDPAVRLWDSMYAAYIMCVEPQGLKPLAFRWCGMRMNSYQDTVGKAGLEKQLAYLQAVIDMDFAKPDPRVVYENDGTARMYSPQSISKTARRIVADVESGKTNKNGEPTDPLARWKKVDREVRDSAELELGPMPVGSLDDIPLDDAIRYAARDPDATRRLYFRLSAAMEAQDLLMLHADGMEALPVFEEMQYNGIPADRDYFVRLRDRMTQEMDRIRTRISNKYVGGEPFNPNSVPQVRSLMVRRGLAGEKLTKTGKISTGKKSVEHLRFSDDAVREIIEWREHAKIRDGFCNQIIEEFPPGVTIHPIRTTIKTTRTATRRISTAGIPLAAIPVRHELGLEVRRGFTAPEGEAFGSWDLSQIEMRYMAHLSRDPLLVQFFNEDRDVHAETAARIFGIDLRDVKEMDHRYPAKRAGFGIITNITGSGLYDQLRMFGCEGWSEEACDDLIREWLNVYKGVRKFLDDCRHEVKRNGAIRDHWGMPRYLPGVWAYDKKTRAEAERTASSHKIQGGAQGMIQKSMAWLRPHIRAMQDAGLNVRWIMQVHDELMLQFDEELWEMLDPLIIEGMTKHSLKLIVPVKAKGAMARTWGELKG